MIETPLGTVVCTGAPVCGRLDSGTWGVVWRRTGPASEEAFSMRLDAVGASGGASTGEWLDAMTFEGAGGFVSYGGPDIEFLHALADGRHLPARWAALLPSDMAAAGRYRVDLDGATITWRLPGLLADESLTLCATVAWSADEMTAWSAVDLNVHRFDEIVARVLPA